MAREKLVILGGGVGAMAAAFALSREGWRDRYESITVYQMGWRIGGKGASGRGRYARIEEHGLHLWLGFYENAFRVMQQCYAELGRPAGAPLARWDDAFKKASFVVVEDQHRGTWRHWPTAFPEDERVPGVPDPNDPEFTVWEYVVRALGFLMRLPGVRVHVEAEAPEAARGRHSIWRDITRGARRLLEEVEATLEGMEAAALAAATELALHLPADISKHDPAHHTLLFTLLERFARWFRARAEARLDRDDDARWTWQVTDITLAAIRGLRSRRRPRVQRVARAARRLAQRRRLGPAARRVRSRVRVPRRRPHAARALGGPGPARVRADVLRLQGRDVLEDAGRHGRRGVRAAL